jgi:hypothetical protein
MHSGDIIYPNIYLVVFGPSNDKKTTALRRIDSCNLLGDFPAIKIIRAAGSVEGLGDELQVNGTRVFVLYWEEFSNVLAQIRWTGSTLAQFMTEIFDCPSVWQRNYRKKPIQIEQPTPTILTASTPEWFWKNARAEDFYGGLLNRFFFLHAVRGKPLPNPEPVQPKLLDGIKTALSDLYAIKPQEVVWSTEAKKLWNDFYLEIEGEERGGLLGAATRRTHVYCLKLSMVYAAFEKTLPEITADQLNAAIAVGRYGIAAAGTLLEMQAIQSQPQGELEQRMLRWVSLHQGERVRRMQQKMHRYCGSAEIFNRCCRNLRDADQLVVKDKCVFLTA